MSSLTKHIVPPWLQGYDPSWLSTDVLAGVTLTAIAIPEVMGYTSIAQTPIVTGLYTIIFPTMAFALLGSSRLLVVGADSATAALLAAGLGAAAISGVTPGSQEWLAYTSFVALLCGGLLLIARLLRLGFLGDFLSASVLVGFLTGVGVQVLTGQIPSMLGIPKEGSNWLVQQWNTLTHVPDLSWPTFAFAAGTLALIFGFKRFFPRVPGAIVAVVLSIIVSSATNAQSNGVSVVGKVQGGFPPIGLPQGIDLHDFAAMLGIATSCFVLIIAQSAATSRSFAMKHGQSVDVNRDIVGLSGANLLAGLSSTFVVNGSPTKTQILDGQKGRTQLANLTMSALTLLVALFFTAALADMPNSVLAAIVFVIGLELVDVLGLRTIARDTRAEFVIALATAAVVCVVGVEQGIVLAVVVSILDLVRRQYSPRKFVVVVGQSGEPAYVEAKAGTQSAPGLVIFRYDAELFYANANRFVEDVQRLVESAPDPVEWLVIDAGSLGSIDYSAGKALQGLLKYLTARSVTPALAGVDPGLQDTLRIYGIEEWVPDELVFPSRSEAYEAFMNRREASSAQGS